MTTMDRLCGLINKYMPKAHPICYSIDLDEHIVWFYQNTPTLRKKDLEVVSQIIKDICYDREFCKQIGVNYNMLCGSDILKIKNYVLDVLENKGFKLDLK